MSGSRQDPYRHLAYCESLKRVSEAGRGYPAGGFINQSKLDQIYTGGSSTARRCVTKRKRGKKMLKVVIADDEERVCRLVQVLADWDALGMEVAGIASNGLEALELVKQIHPDILITDIRMPGCYGLELIQHAKESLPQLEIVIISGYAHFEYAQSAIKHGVGDYLLKPIQKGELMTTLRKLGDRCRTRQVEGKQQSRRYSQEDCFRLQNRLVLDLAEQRLKAPTAQILEQEYCFAIQPGLLQILLLKLDYDLEQFSSASVSVIWEKAKTIFVSVLRPVCQNAVFYFQDAWGCAILNYAPDQKEALRGRLREGLNQLVAQRALFGPVEFSLGLSTPSAQPEGLPQQFWEANDVVCERLLEGSGRLLEGRPVASSLAEENLLERYGRNVELLLDTLEQPQASQAVDLLQESALAVPGVRGRELLELVRSAGKLFALRVCGEEARKETEYFEKQCLQCSRAQDLFTCLKKFQQRLLERTLQRRENESQRPIRVAKQYVQSHYSQNITLEDVCAATGFSVSYFSALFKKETGEGFAKYLTRVRMERAKELLQETNLSVAEICSRVGYVDLKHFNQTFKKVTSLSPGQYRKLYG